jgi:hypothetical protein
MIDKVKAWQRGQSEKPSDTELIDSVWTKLIAWAGHRIDGYDALASHELDEAIALLQKIREEA